MEGITPPRSCRSALSRTNSGAVCRGVAKREHGVVVVAQRDDNNETGLKATAALMEALSADERRGLEAGAWEAGLYPNSARPAKQSIRVCIAPNLGECSLYARCILPTSRPLHVAAIFGRIVSFDVRPRKPRVRDVE